MTNKIWTTLCIYDRADPLYCQKSYKTRAEAEDAAKKKTANDREGDAYGVFELVAITKPIVPDIEITAVTA